MKRFWTSFAAAASRPEVTAVVDRNGSRKTTYSSLDKYSSQIAAELIRLGTAPETLNAVFISAGYCPEVQTVAVPLCTTRWT